MLNINTTSKVGYYKKQKKTNLSKVNTTPDRSKNQGGLLGMLGYVGGSIAAGIGGIGEGIIDASIAPLADIFGQHDYAEYLFKNNVVGDWYSSVTEEYNPTGIMQFVGDVTHGLGQSSVLFIPYAGAPMFFQGVMSQGISSAVAKTGDVGVKEAAYGLTTGAIEAGLEYVVGAAGQGAKSIGSAIAKKGGKSAVKSIFSTAARKGLVSKILSSAAGEFFEEAASEVIDVGLQRMYNIDPNAKITLKDVLYAGVVGAVSGAVSGGAVEVYQTVNHRARGQKIIQNGNAQTLINTATSVADKLAGQGTNFKKAPEWVKTLRGEVDAYNKLKPEEKLGAKGQTILGEMHASLFYAETQAVHYGLTEAIKKSSEENRATLAEYVNQTIPKDKRSREYTAEDIAKDTDGITQQLAILQFAGNEFINYADAIASLEADQAQEGAIGDVVGAMQGEEAQRTAAAQAEQGAEVNLTAEPVANQANAVNIDANAGIDGKVGVTKFSIAKTLNMGWRDQLKNTKRSDTLVVSKNTPSYISEKGINNRPLAIPKSVITKAQSRKDESHSISNKNINNLPSGIYNAIASIDDKKRNSFIIVTNLTENGKPIIVSFLKDAVFDGDNVHQATSIHVRQDLQMYLSKFDSADITVLKKNELDNLLRKGTHNDARVQETEKLNENSISQNKPSVKPKTKNNSKRDLAPKTAQESGEVAGQAVESKSKEKSGEAKNEGEAGQKSGEATLSNAETVSESQEGGESEPIIKQPKESLTDEQRRERARERAKRLIEWEKKTSPTVKELNDAREYVKDFDSLPAKMQTSVIRMIRSAEGKVDKKIVKAVANLMTLRRRNGSLVTPDLEFRFAEGIGDRGLYTHVGDRTLVLINADTDFKNTIRGTIAHELVHYIENKQGYGALALYARRTTRPEAIAKIEKEYNEHYEAVYTAEEEANGLRGDALKKKVAERMATEEHKELIDSEVVARIVGDRMTNEKFLQRYAQKDDAMIKKLGRFLKGAIAELKNKDKETTTILYDMTRLFDNALGGQVVSESTGTKYNKAEVDQYFKGAVERSKESTLTKEEREAMKAEEAAASKQVHDFVLKNARYYFKSEFNKAFWEAKSVGGEVLGDILSGKKTSVKGDDLDRIKSAVYTAMFKASAEGKVGAVEAVKVIAEKAAQRYIDNQTVYDEESKRWIPLKKYVDDVELLTEYEKALSEMLFNSFANSGKNLRNFQDFSLQKKAAEEFRQMYFDFKELEKYKKQASNNAMDLKQLANMQKRSAADEGIRLLTKAMGDTVNKHGMIRASKIDAVLAQVSDFYNLETNVKIFGESENGEQLKSLTDYAQVYDKGARNKIDKLLKLRKDRQGKALTSEEMKLWAQILGAMRATINQYNGLYKDGKWFDRTKVAGDLAKDVVSYFGYNTEKKFKNVFLEGLYKTGKWLKENYFYSVLSPETVIEGLEGYAHRGVLKTFFHSVRDASALADTVRAKLLTKFETFLDSNENVWEEKNRKIKFREKLNKKSIDLFGNEITLGEAIYLYGLCKREHAQAGLAKEGIKIYDENGKLKKQIREIDAEKARDYLYNQFDAVDRKYIDMVEEFFNKTSTEMKSRADLEYLGYSNTISGYYIPILRDRFSRDRRTTDRRSSIADIITVYNEQFNQHVVQNAKPCEITNIQQIVSTHAKGLADYSCLYMPLKSFDRLYNAPVILDDGRSTTIREILNDVWPDADNYLADLFGDIQGVGRPTGRFDTLDKLAQKITNTWVPSVLSGNLSVIMNQTTSYISASQAIEPKYLVQAMGAIGHNMKEIGDRADEYSKIILSRSFEEGAIRSQTNVEQVNKVGKFLGKGIEYTDRQICLLIFHAAEINAEANGDGAIGTVENSRAAAIIADKVIQETQSMTSPAERGAWQRSPNMLSRAVTQFAGDSMKGFSYTFSSVARFLAHKNRVKAGDTEYEADLKQDAKKIGRSVATIAATSAYMAAIAWLMRLVLNTTEDEPEEEALNVLGDFAGNVVGVMPLVSDMYSYFVDGYEITPTSIDLINDTMKSTQNMLSLLGRSVSGGNVTYEETVKGIRGALVSIGSLTGIPVNPIIKQATGIVRRISPSAIYWYDSALSSESFSHDLKRALEKGDERLAQTILEMRYKHESTGEINGEELLEICRLYQLKNEEGAYRTDVIPQKIPDEITKRKQRKQFESIYGEASGAVIKLIDSFEYKNLTDEEKIKAIKNTYKLYYNKAKSAVLGTEITNAEAYAIILDDTSNLYLSQAKKSSMIAYEGKDGKEVSVKDQVKEYLNLIDLTEEEYTVINYALGYRGKENKAKLLKYINTLNLSDKDKEQIANRLGFLVENGKIVEKEKK